MADITIRVLLEPVEEMKQLRLSLSDLGENFEDLKNKYSILEHKYALSLEESMILRDKLKAMK